tara:strand:- start:6832 stop:7275 length:444 start_codon:yes stop_codon:yes gene_type:complete
MKESWQQLCVGDVITIKRGNKFACVFVSDIPGYPITKSDLVEVVDFFSNNIRTYSIDYDEYVNLDANYNLSINYKYKEGSLVKINVGKKEKLMGTIISTYPPEFKAYPDHHRTLIHTFFTPQYSVMLVDGSETIIKETKLSLVSKPS